MNHYLFILCSLFLSCSTNALSLSQKRDLLVDYVNEHYPNIPAAINSNTYELLLQFNPFIMFQRQVKASDTIANYSRAMLVGAFFEASENPPFIHRYDFSFADLAFANLSLLDLSKSNFTNAIAYHADLSQSTLDCGLIRGLDLRGANLYKTNIVIHKNEKYVTRTILEFCGAIVDNETTIISPLRFNHRP